MASQISIDQGSSSRDGLHGSILEEFSHSFTHNLFKPLLLFFFLGLLVPILRVEFEFPNVLYQALTIYLLLAIGWHGGEELAKRPSENSVTQGANSHDRLPIDHGELLIESGSRALHLVSQAGPRRSVDGRNPPSPRRPSPGVTRCDP
jgi:hypothetical protein